MRAREFKPAPKPPPGIGKCPSSLCKRVNSLTFTGKFTQHGDRIYVCGACGAKVGAPTDYAECDLFDEPIAKDVFWNPCLKCPHRRPVADGRPGHGVCIHFKKAKWHGDIAGLAEEVERATRRVRKFGPGGEV